MFKVVKIIAGGIRDISEGCPPNPQFTPYSIEELRELRFPVIPWPIPNLVELEGKPSEKGSYSQAGFGLNKFLPQEKKYYELGSIPALSNYEIPRHTLGIQGKYRPLGLLEMFKISQYCNMSTFVMDNPRHGILEISRVKLPLVGITALGEPLPHTWERLSDLNLSSIKDDRDAPNVNQELKNTIMTDNISDRFILDLKKMKENWENLSKEDRLSLLGTAVSNALWHASSAAVNIKSDSRFSTIKFLPSEWTIGVNVQLLTSKNLGKREFKKLVINLFREMRRAEQCFQSARYLYSIGLYRETRFLKLPPDILNSARDLTMRYKTEEWWAAKRIYDDYRSDFSARKKITAKLEKYDEAGGWSTLIRDPLNYLVAKWQFNHLPIEKNDNKAAKFIGKRLKLIGINTPV